jgi:hypothetical protein
MTTLTETLTLKRKVPSDMSLFSLLRSLPLIGPVLKIANTYAFQGDYRADCEFAGVRSWVRAIGPELTAAAILTVATMAQFIYQCWTVKALVACPDAFYCKPGALIIAIVPSTLGLGIGVYALIFALSEVFVKSVKEAIDKQKAEEKRNLGSELMLNSDLAFPLLVLIISLISGVVQQIAPASLILIFLSWLTAWYALIAVLSLVSVIFGMAEHSLLDKVKNSGGR